MHLRTLLVVSLISVGCDDGAPTREAAVDNAVDAETLRLKRHFDAVLGELERADTAHLSAAQRGARADHIAELRRYRDRGVFPHNHDFPGQRVPHFVDAHGTRCALGHLIEESGDSATVERIATTRNNAYVAELADDPALVAWLDRAGLSAEEAARIQPAYGCEFFPEQCPREEEITAIYGTISAVVDVTNVVALALNVRPSGKGRAWLGIAAGVFGVGLGIPKLDEEGPVRTLGAFNFGLGALSAAVGIYALVNSPSSSAPVAAPLSTSFHGVTVEPVIAPGSLGVRGQF